jgi:hypothetical protein
VSRRVSCGQKRHARSTAHAEWSVPAALALVENAGEAAGLLVEVERSRHCARNTRQHDTTHETTHETTHTARGEHARHEALLQAGRPLLAGEAEGDGDRDGALEGVAETPGGGVEDGVALGDGAAGEGEGEAAGDGSVTTSVMKVASVELALEPTALCATTTTEHDVPGEIPKNKPHTRARVVSFECVSSTSVCVCGLNEPVKVMLVPLVTSAGNSVP